MAELVRGMKRQGFSDAQLGALAGVGEAEVRRQRHALGIRPSYKTVDTCAGEFPSATPYLYSTYDEENESVPFGREAIVILGSGPNRIGQGVEFDYCCVRAALAFRELGYRTIMINSNPETVSTDFDISDKLYFEALTFEDVLEIVELERPLGVVVQLGGQTPLRLTKKLEAAGVAILGTSPDAIDTAEDRRRFEAIARQLGIAQPPSGTATSPEEALAVAERVGYPVLVRPSYVLGGRAMEIVYDAGTLRTFFERAARVAPEHPVLIDRFLEDAFEADVDAIADGERCVIGGVMQHIEDAGIHSGDSACVLPPYLIGEREQDEMRRHTKALAAALGVVGLINVQYAIRDGVVYCLEVNPRGSRTVPFVSKATGVPLAKLAAGVMVGRKLADLGFTEEVEMTYVAVKEAVFPFTKLPGVDAILGPGDALDGRGDGDRRLLRLGVREGPDRGRGRPAARGGDPRDGERQRQADRGPHRPAVPRDGVPAVRHGGDGALLAETGDTVRTGPQGVGGPAERGGPDRVRAGAAVDQHAAGGSSPSAMTTRCGAAALTHRVAYTTTMSAASAACDAVIALRSTQGDVRSLQERHGRGAPETAGGR